MRTLIAGLFLFAGAGFVTAQDDEGKYTDKAGKYTVTFPAGVKVMKMNQDQAGLKMFTAAAADKNNNAFVVMYADFPDAVKDVEPKIIFDGAQKGAAGDGKVTSSKDLTHGTKKYPAREIVIDKGGMKLRARIILANTRMYIAIVGGGEDFADSKEAKDFIKSLELK
jgi:hypothetical protein